VSIVPACMKHEKMEPRFEVLAAQAQRLAAENGLKVT
jgi:hypothetical protein